MQGQDVTGIREAYSLNCDGDALRKWVRSVKGGVDQNSWSVDRAKRWDLAVLVVVVVGIVVGVVERGEGYI